MYSGILELKNHASIFHTNGSFANEMRFGLDALFVKTKIYFYLYNFVNKQTKTPSAVKPV